MATKTFDELKQLAIQIRDEKANKQNTANRVGAAMLEAINKLEQDYYDKTNIDEQAKNTTQSITSLGTKIDKRTTEYNVSVNNPTSGTNGGNKYDLSTAIGQVPSELRAEGLKVSFLNSAGKPESWKYQGGSWAVASFIQESAGGNKILTWVTDAATTRKQVSANERKGGMQISYKPDDEDWVNEQYVGTSFTDTEWAKDANWVSIPKESEVAELSNKIDSILGSSEIILIDKIELGVREKVTLPTNISNDRLIQIELLTQGLSGNTLWSNGFSINNSMLKYNFPFVRPYINLKDFCFDFQGAEKIAVRVTLLAQEGILSENDKLLYQGIYRYNLSTETYGLKPGDQLLFKNVSTDYTDNPAAFFIYKNMLGGTLLGSVNAGFEYSITLDGDTDTIAITKPGDGSGNSEVQVYLVSSSNEELNQLISHPLSDEDFISSGDSITAWSSATDPGIEGVEKFEGWANLLNSHIGFKTYKNIAVPGASYTQSSQVGGYIYSINRQIKNDLPEGFSGIFTMMGGTNDYNGSTQLGTCEDTMTKTYEELDGINNTTNFSTICDGFRYCLETAIRRCSWRARIFVMTCVPRNDKSDYFTVSEMNEQIKLIAKSFHVPVLDLFSELNLRNGLDQFGETWKLSEVSEDGGTENVHPNAETQKIMMRYIFGKLLTYIR
ncbi:SGNH/GDSL hydrolase family protein [Phocaeicola plebeius]|uniref:SGNH/GDSL hydrolase family protein n=1 Tax=Phocaeicola plebeius TaxID=310297 RepID=UPI003AB399C3